MDMKDIFALLDRFDASAATGLELDMAGVHLNLTKGAVCAVPGSAPVPVPAAPVPVQTAVEAAPISGDFIKAPLVGTFYRAASPENAPFAAVGSEVKKGQTVCVLEAMKMMSEVPAPADCVIEEVLAQDGGLVGYDAPLFRVRLV